MKVLLLYESHIPRGVDPHSLTLFVSDRGEADVVIDLQRVEFRRCPLFDRIVIGRRVLIDPTPLLQEGGKVYSLTPTNNQIKKDREIWHRYSSFWKGRGWTLERLVGDGDRIYGVWFRTP